MLPLAARGWLLACSASLAAGVALPGCADENDPATWVKRIDDPGQKLRSIKRLREFFEDAMTRANSKLDDPQVVAVLDKIAEPLAKAYTSGTLDDKTREEVLQTLGSMKDPRAQTAYAKALKDYEPMKTERELRFASQAVLGLASAQKQLDPALVETLWSTFTKFRASKTNSIEATRYLHDAVLAVKHPSWGSKAAEMLKAPVKLGDPESERDQLQFWQTTAIQIIAELKAEPAVPALIDTLVTPSKGALNGSIKNALLSVPIPATRALSDVLAGRALADKAKEFETPGLMTAIVADSLGHISRPEGRDAVLAALGAADLPPMARFGLAQSLALFPHDPRLVPAFEGAIAKLPADAKTPQGLDARAALMQTASMFYDPNMVDWLIKESIGAKGDETTRLQIRLLTLDAAIKLMNPTHKAAVEGAVKKAETDLQKDARAKETFKHMHEMLKYATEGVDRCKEDAACYINVLGESIPANPPTANMRHVKAAYMAAIYGAGSSAAQTRLALLKRIDAVKSPSARLAIAQAIDRLAPDGDQKASDDLERMVESDKKAGDKGTLSGDDAVVKVAKRLRARAAK
jgi:hypothetical protein